MRHTFVLAAIMAICLAGCSSSADDHPNSHDALPPAGIAARIETLSGITDSKAPTATTQQNFVVSVTADSLYQAGDRAMEVLHVLQNHAQQSPYSGVYVDVALNLVDGYGRKSAPPLLRLAYSKEDVTKIDFSNIMATQVLNLAIVSSLDPASNKIAGDECSTEKDLAKAAPAFCHVAIDAPENAP